ncbi:unnamed protein product [Didymodactylos carnosus]|uniref:Uncharacterized protein n=1 Tax=Didymodactylos carnosus TaxID=1234261 RepID=A0A813VLA1_9BILA|nr:unnamed protein product [Didymodactylos carnosus]CAF0839101.1 unnamed protein product [Didymodactylos carnosus]CAF3535090.1 unnamed protein product [Didymodactylos carnosus]CAF3626383.1 unnamed protein product [Didymodactylos carnosus]
MFHQIIILALLIIFCIQYSYAVRCNDGTDPCQLLTGRFFPPYYTCFEAENDNVNVYCTCPDGPTTLNAPCRICNTVTCGVGATCLEPFTGFAGLYYACGCRNNTGYYANPGPCPGL